MLWPSVSERLITLPGTHCPAEPAKIALCSDLSFYGFFYELIQLSVKYHDYRVIAQS